MSSGTVPVERTAVLTGAASPRGIGRALADRLAGDGWAVAILDLDADASRQAADDIAARHGVRVVGVAADVTDEKSVDEAISAVEEQLPPVVALGNLAGISDPSPFLEVTLEEWERVFAVNVRGAFLTTRRVLPGMIDQHLGRIVCVSSISAQRGGGTFSKVPYSASKAALLGFTRAVAREVGEYGVTVNAVAPGPIDTDIMGGTLTDERRAQLAAGSLVGRIGTPAEVAALMAYLMGPDAGFITAATYDINGGLQIS
jgi:2-hydroxycyclohexanecarboxyl-CoA dehydrogenase